MNAKLTTTSFLGGISKLTQFALISASGADATKFLHSQFTNEITSLPLNKACLAGYCSTKGRLLTDLLIWKTSEESVLMEVPTELQESFQKRLQIFVMRAKVTLDRLIESHTILGILGETSAQTLSEWFPKIPSTSYEVVTNEFGTLLRVADAANTARYQWILTNTLCEQIWPTVSTQLAVLSERAWALSEIHAGIPHITQATQEKFVPQMVNYDLIDALHFKKGCYPGQEIVARTHYLGKQKRRMVLARLDHAEVKSGMELFAQDDSSQPCGMIVNAEPNNHGGSDCLIEIKLAYLSGTVVQLSSGEACRWLELPYSLPSEA